MDESLANNNEDPNSYFMRPKPNKCITGSVLRLILEGNFSLAYSYALSKFIIELVIEPFIDTNEVEVQA